MIIECKNCLKKFTVRDSDIPIQGRVVQCSNCSSQWQQMPIAPSVTAANLDVDKLKIINFLEINGPRYCHLAKLED